MSLFFVRINEKKPPFHIVDEKNRDLLLDQFSKGEDYLDYMRREPDQIEKEVRVLLKHPHIYSLEVYECVDNRKEH
jgi:hypothetical protein